MNSLFVYGSLRSASEHPMAKFLAENAHRIDEGYIYGYLKNMGPYPAAILDVERKSKVWGEIYRWNETIASFILSVIDEYEGYEVGNEEDSEFLRREVDVFGSQYQYRCYIYVYHPTLWVGKGNLVLSGNYLDVEK